MNYVKNSKPNLKLIIHFINTYYYILQYRLTGNGNNLKVYIFSYFYLFIFAYFEYIDLKYLA